MLNGRLTSPPRQSVGMRCHPIGCQFLPRQLSSLLTGRCEVVDADLSVASANRDGVTRREPPPSVQRPPS